MRASIILPSLARAFGDGATVDSFGKPATIRVHDAGRLVAPTGRIGACDPGLFNAEPFSITIDPGTYPVRLCIVSYPDDSRIAAAWVEIRPEPPSQFTEAQTFGVDNGMFCFIDMRAMDSVPDTAAFDRFWVRLREECAKVEAPTREWGSVTVDERSGANIVAFSSGSGDGGYVAYYGYGPSASLVCIIIDFGLLLSAAETDELNRLVRRRRQWWKFWNR